MKLVKVVQSRNPKKKYDAVFLKDNGKEKIVGFGAKGFRDFTLLNDKNSEFYLSKKEDREKVRENYQRRHKKDLLTENNKKGLGAGALSFFLLWTTPKMNINKYKKMFNL